MEPAVLIPWQEAQDVAPSSVLLEPVERDPEGLALAAALEAAEPWPAEILTLALAALGDIRLPEPAVPTRNADVLAALPLLYWVHGLDQAGLLATADTVAGLWASGAVQAPLPDHGAELQAWWRQRRQRLSEPERAQLLNQIFAEQDFEPAMRRLCQALVALADNAGQHDIREETGLHFAAQQLLDLCATRLEGAPMLAAPELLTQVRAAVRLLSQRPLQAAFAVRDLYALIDAQRRARTPAGVTAAPGSAQQWAERAQAGAAVLRWLAQSAAQGFGIDPAAASLQTLMAQAQRWLMSASAG